MGSPIGPPGPRPRGPPPPPGEDSREVRLVVADVGGGRLGRVAGKLLWGTGEIERVKMSLLDQGSGPSSPAS